jgi:hypothetical protein
VLLVGDWAQLSPVQAGGAFKLLATDRDDVPQLLDVRRFRHEWERDATLKLRAGRPTVADEYVRRGRVVGGDRDTVLDALFQAWQADLTAGRTSLMIAADAQTVTDLNTRARAHRVGAGAVTRDGVTVADGSTIGIGDHITTRLNQRDLTPGNSGNDLVGEWVKNGDQWIVTQTLADGSLQVRRPTGGRVVRLPADYVAGHVELGYATTAHRAQGRTVDTAHAYVTATTTREPLYVMATRGRASNRLYVDTGYDPDPATAHDEIELMDPGDVIRAVLARAGADTSATAARAVEAAAATNPARIAAQGGAVIATRREDRYVAVLTGAGIGLAEIETAKDADTWRLLADRMHHAECLGVDLGGVADQAAFANAGEGARALDIYEGRLVHEMSRVARDSERASVNLAQSIQRTDLGVGV